MQPFDFQLHTRVVYGAGALARLGALARELDFRRTLVVADRGLVASGHVAEASGVLAAAGVDVVTFHEFDVNPDTNMCALGRDFAAPLAVDSIIGLGGGSSLDCAKGINFLLTNGGEMRDYHGYGKAAHPMLPMLAVPTTAGTGSEAQTYALISDAATHVKLACGDSKAAFRVAVLDPALTVSQPSGVTAAAGFDAIAHAVESYVTTRRNAVSDTFAREAWALLEANYERVLTDPQDLSARGAMQLGAFYAGVAIEHSMLGATHACANPLTQHYGTTHGEAVALLLPHVVRWNAPVVASRYGELMRVAGQDVAEESAGDALAARLDELKAAGALDTDLNAAGVPEGDLEMLAADAAGQWTGTFNPRPFDAGGALELYRRALQSQFQNA
ncbi:MAG TPA: iron-containing alcohol dehydrogenase [Pyrinomonadaceae bacterium]